ncbi:uncharacterized protein Dana_GF17859 [Drosophila ananassae]|uniref:Carbonic anhydrase n=1 Tax=Drosophila ananassae TaxID=7217 RepID=B3M1T1_DROAN|nr:putative carbonic anhydrase 3 [Drosophila ananassae]EDV42191.2 uncharacterized protein Dana_GF17859 [Drosophila ananassae]
MHFITSWVLAFCSLALGRANDWGYPDWETDSTLSFPKWGGLCDSGTRQSPININAITSLKGEFDPLKLKNYDDPQSDLQMVNNGHSIQLSGFDDDLIVSGGGLLSDYVVEQVHFHWWSEHTINDIRYPLEMHIVHRNTIYPNMSMASEFKDGLLVIGVLFHASPTPNQGIEKIVEHLKDVKNASNINNAVSLKINKLAIMELLPNMDNYFTYAGSLTTPNCAEVVTWIVMSETRPVTFDQVKQFKEIEHEEGKQLTNNYRENQSLNDRAVVFVMGQKSGASGVTGSLALSLIVLVAGQKFL